MNILSLDRMAVNDMGELPPSFLVTGANGFVGKVLCNTLLQSGQSYCVLARQKPFSDHQNTFLLTDVESGSQHLPTGLQTCIHLAARAHFVIDNAVDPMNAFIQANVDFSVRVARQAVKAGVNRFVYVSSIKVNGEATSTEAFSEYGIPRPVDAYGQSKLLAEQALQTLCAETGMELVILRPPLVYGPEVKANFLQLVQLVARAPVLPFGAIVNRRSMIYVGNLVDAILLCAIHPAAHGKTFMLSDGVAMSTPELVKQIATAMQKSVRMIAVPLAILHRVAALAGRAESMRKLTDSLEVDDRAIRQVLAWQPPYLVSEGIMATVDWYLASRKNTKC